MVESDNGEIPRNLDTFLSEFIDHQISHLVAKDQSGGDSFLLQQKGKAVSALLFQEKFIREEMDVSVTDVVFFQFVCEPALTVSLGTTVSRALDIEEIFVAQRKKVFGSQFTAFVIVAVYDICIDALDLTVDQDKWYVGLAHYGDGVVVM